MQLENGPGTTSEPARKHLLRAVLNDDGEIFYRMKTRQKLFGKYLLREVFD
jgi:hypothetical protein